MSNRKNLQEGDFMSQFRKTTLWTIVVIVAAVVAMFIVVNRDRQDQAAPLPSPGLVQQGSVVENETPIRGISSNDRNGDITPQITLAHSVCSDQSQSAAFTLLGNGDGDVIITVRKATSQPSEIYHQYIWTATGNTTSQWDFVVPTPRENVEINATGGGGTADAVFVNAC